MNFISIVLSPLLNQAVIHVRNKLLSDSAAIHWHGIHQRGTPWMDGVGYITQCPIGPGQTFTYKFKVHLHDSVDSRQIFFEEQKYFLH